MILRMAVCFLLLVSASAARAASIVTEWTDDAVSAANEVAWEPTVAARFFAIWSTAIYDAWTAYDPTAIAVVSGTALKNQGGAANEANKREAISHAAYTVLAALAPQRRRALAERMAALGYDAKATTAPAEVGRRAANAMLGRFREDGANEAGGFADTTGYRPAGAEEAARWQPILSLGKPQLPTTPQWSRVLPFALRGADRYRPPPPPAPGSKAWSDQISVDIEVSAALTDAQKAAPEFWNEWGSSPPSHLVELTKFASDHHDLRTDDDVKLFFVVSNALLDASIAAWDAKYAYDYVRPITAIRSLGDASIRTWRPRSLPAVLAYSSPATDAALALTAIPAGIAEMRASDWEPYLPTPPFPSYVAGHSTFCTAWARVMTLATDNAELRFRKIVTRLYVEQRPLSPPVALDYPTYEAAAETCGQSRVWGGVHWPEDIARGRELGRRVGENAWARAQQFLMGAASPATAALAALHAPFWFHESHDSGQGAKFGDAGGLAIDLAAGASGTWRSIALDPMPVGDYELRLIGRCRWRRRDPPRCGDRVGRPARSRALGSEQIHDGSDRSERGRDASLDQRRNAILRSILRSRCRLRARARPRLGRRHRPRLADRGGLAAFHRV
ncbi:MAG TPA: vanadium-dependent haloperoxidase [Stellaceae bacterium]|nr:vanadium-dependent haloperoxidase [Stellaceae bacterium]